MESSLKAFVNNYVKGERTNHITFFNNSDARDDDLSFTQEYNIKNQGPAAIIGSSLKIKFPIFALNGDPIIKDADLQKPQDWFPIASPLRIMKFSKTGGGYQQCKLVNKNEMQLQLLDLQRTRTESFYQKGDASFDCGKQDSAICGEFLCELGNFEESLQLATD